MFTILAASTASITVSLPNGGESWIWGSSHNITWTTTGTITNVVIEYSTDNGTGWTQVTASTPNDGSHAWTVPYAYSTQCKVRVSDASDAGVFDVSDALFNIYSDSAEPNNDSATAAVLPLGATANLIFESENNYNQDWYKFFVPVAEAGKDLKVNVRVTSPYPDPLPYDWWASDIDFELLDNSLRVLGVAVTRSDNESLYLHGVTSGWYYINIGYCTTDYADSSDYCRYTVSLETGTGFGIGYVSGRVVDGNGLGYENVFVLMDPLSNDWNIPRPYMTTGPGGDFTIAYAPGTYTLLFTAGIGISANFTYTHPNVVGEYYNNTRKIVDADPVSFSSGQTLNLGDVVLDIGAIVSGNVTNLSANALVNVTESSTSALANITVRSYDLEGNAVPYEGYVLTDAGGNYTLSRIPVGGAKLRFNSVGYATEFYNDKPTLGSADLLSTQSGVTITGINAQLGVGGTISGTVADGLGAGIANVRVQLWSVLDSTFTRASILSASGSGDFNFSNVKPGDYKIYFNTTGLNYAPEWYNEEPSYAQATVVNVTEGGTTAGINAQLLLNSITVTSPNGGEIWAVGSGQNITWTSTGTVGNVNIDYSSNSGGSWTSVAAGTANDGSYAWTVPSTPSATCLVRVGEADDGSPTDQSDAVFTITVSAVETVSAPTTPTGPTTGTISTSYDFSTGGATSSLGHALQYKFDWDDGSDSGWLAAGTTQAAHSWAAAGTYDVRAMARCASDTAIESPWSSTYPVIITDGGTTG
ncbi:MAG: hypothetical protein KKE86_17320, partial [Planctomycetes bacterium]|nr:hypothetical protein [Planctomycetota bacterium]